MEGGTKTKKIIYRKSNSCIFMLQGIQVCQRDILIGCSLDCWLFAYDLTGDAYSSEPQAETRIHNYPANNANYSANKDILVCGTVGGALYLFQNFSKQYFNNVKYFKTTPDLCSRVFAICTYWQEDRLWSLNYPASVFKVDPVNQPESQILETFCKLKDKVANAIYFNPPGGSGPRLAICFALKNNNRPPVLLRNMDEYAPSLNLHLDDAEEELSLSTCMAYSLRTNEIVVGHFDGKVRVYTIVGKGNRYFCDLKLAYDFEAEKLILAVQCDESLFVMNLIGIKWLDLQRVERKGAKRHAESVQSINSLITCLGKNRVIIGNKTLKILNSVSQIKTCCFRVFDIPKTESA